MKQSINIFAGLAMILIMASCVYEGNVKQKEPVDYVNTHIGNISH